MTKTTAVALNSKTALNKLKKEVMDEFLTSNQEVYKAGLRSLTIQEQKYNQQIEAIRADIAKLHEARAALDNAFLAGEMDDVMAKGYEAAAAQQEKGLADMAGDNYVEKAQASLDTKPEPAPRYTDERALTLEEVAKPLMQWMAQNNCPHSHVVVSATSAEIFHGVQSFNTFEFVKD